MRFIIEKNGISIIPENKIDEAYIEDTLMLKEEGDYIKLIRKHAIQFPGCLSELTTNPYPAPKKFTDKSKPIKWTSFSDFVVFSIDVKKSLIEGKAK